MQYLDCRIWLYSTASPGELNKLDSIQRAGKRIYTDAFNFINKITHVEADDQPLKLKRNELGLKLLYKLRSNTLDDSEKEQPDLQEYT